MLSAIETLALSKVRDARNKETKAARAEVEAGAHAVDFVVHVHGTVKVGEDYVQEQHMRAPQWALIAVLADKLNEATLKSAVEEAYKLQDAKAPAVATAKERVQRAVFSIKGKTNKVCNGKVTHELVATKAVDLDVKAEVA